MSNKFSPKQLLLSQESILVNFTSTHMMPTSTQFNGKHEMTTCQNDTRLQPDLSSKKESISSKDGQTNCRHYKNRFKKRKKK